MSGGNVGVGDMTFVEKGETERGPDPRGTLRTSPE